MKRKRAPSPAARRLLAALAAAPGEWRHGYILAETAGILSGTLYPLLMRLEREGFLDAEWRDSIEPGRPPRHVCRLTASGRALAAAYPPERAAASGSARPVPR